jgi:hypothetical protein
VHLSRKCDKTGWPIDLKVKSEDGKELALYFLLQEEMCLNVTTGQEEPLALQKLMLKHVRHIRGVPVKFVGENEFHQVSQQSDEAKD